MSRKTLILPVVALLVWAMASVEVFACGNKFLVPSRGTRFGKVPIARTSVKILVYAPPNSTLANALGDVSVASVLTKVGYQPTTVADPDDLDAALRQGGWDLVLADLDDTSTVRERVPAKEEPAILPVLHEPTRAELAVAKHTYGEAIRAPAKSQRFVETVDFAVAERAQRLTAAAP